MASLHHNSCEGGGWSIFLGLWPVIKVAFHQGSTVQNYKCICTTVGHCISAVCFVHHYTGIVAQHVLMSLQSYCSTTCTYVTAVLL